MLKSKKILIFVSGSIAIYKTLLLIRLLRKEGAEVRIVATRHALKFITILSFEVLSGHRVLHDENECWVQGETNYCNHISYAKWADIAIFAPISVNSISKLAHGIADNVYLSTALALPDIPKILATSANTFMLHNPIIQKNIETLQRYAYHLIPAVDGNLACGDNGNGAMADINEIIFQTKRLLMTQAYWHNVNVIVTGGGSKENIDSIRCISNHSSGLQASYLVLALYYLGANVYFISSQTPIQLPKSVNVSHVFSSQDYLHAINTAIYDIQQNKETSESYNNDKNSTIYLFMVAAISDYIPLQKSGKLKKQDLGEKMLIELKQNIDILQSLNYKNLVKIAFKAECDSKNALSYARQILDSKKCAMVCLNIISENNMSFGNESNEMYFLTKDSQTQIKDTKFNISLKLCEYIQTMQI